MIRRRPTRVECPATSCRTTLLAAAGALLALLVLLPTALAQSSVDSSGLSGPVTSVEEYRWYPGTTERRLFQTLTFGEDGFATERVYVIYSYGDGSVRSRQVTSYDAGWPLATVVYDADDEPTGQTVFRYDGEGRMVEQVTVDAEGVETRRMVYERDASGNLVRQEWYQDGALWRTIERDYDGDGGLIEERRYDGEGRLDKVETYTVPDLEHDYVEYDEEGEVEATGRVIEGEHGALLFEQRDPDGTVTQTYEYAYDERGRVVERRGAHEGETELYTYAYEDDEHGNWIRQTTTENLGDGPEVYEIRERVITYR